MHTVTTGRVGYGRSQPWRERREERRSHFPKYDRFYTESDIYGGNPSIDHGDLVIRPWTGEWGPGDGGWGPGDREWGPGHVSKRSHHLYICVDSSYTPLAQ